MSNRERLRYHSAMDHLPADLKAAYDQFLELPTTTNAAAVRWLREHGHDVSRSAVQAYRARFDKTLQEIERSAEIAAACAKAARKYGVTDLTDAALARFQQLHMQRLWNMKSAAEMDAKQWVEWVKAVGEAVGVKRAVDQQRRRVTAGKSGPARPAHTRSRKSAAAAAAPAGRPGFADTSKTAEVAERVRRALGG